MQTVSINIWFNLAFKGDIDIGELRKKLQDELNKLCENQEFSNSISNTVTDGIDYEFKVINPSKTKEK